MKNTMGLLVLGVLLAVGCDDVRQERSVEKTESANVVDLCYMPANHGEGLGVGTGFTSNGEMAVSVTPVSVDIPAKYAVVFECQHGKFVIENDQAKAREMWGRLKRDQKVTVRYKEVWDVKYEENKEVSRAFKKFDFIDAN